MSEQDLRDTAIDAYVYAYPMVLMELARRKATAVQSPLDGRAPVNQFGHKTAFPDPRAADREPARHGRALFGAVGA
ncbi:hypothetical protein G6F57_023556 [Rhizopus arrhizus]|nr:hypothetical protein G6F57_023556 [Rhizopus arrhizus]